MNSVKLFICQYRCLTRVCLYIGIPLQFCLAVLTLYEVGVPSPALEMVIVPVERIEDFRRIFPARESAFILIRWFVQLVRDDQ